jgi:ParB family chromosome partitioning protein
MKMKSKTVAESTLQDAAQAAKGELRKVDLKYIVDHPELPKSEVDSDWAKELFEDIKNNGLDVPLIVWNGGSDDTEAKVGNEVVPATFLVAGAHRRKALQIFRRDHPEEFAKAFADGIPVKVVGGDLEDAYSARIRENIQRRTLTPSEIFAQVDLLRSTFKMKGVEIAARLGRSTSWVSQVLAVSKELDSDALEKVRSGKLSLTDAQKAAATVRKARKSGDVIDPAAVAIEAEKKAEQLAKANRLRSEKRHSAKTLFTTVQALPRLAMSVRIVILEKVLAYLAGAADSLPKEITVALKSAENLRSDTGPEKKKKS